MQPTTEASGVVLCEQTNNNSKITKDAILNFEKLP